MLELTNGGRMISGLDAIDFMERLADVIDEDVKTEDFCNEFTWTLNRFRYEISKSVPIPPKMETGRKTVYYCGKCRRCLDPSTDKYCSGCGRAINWAALRGKATHDALTCDCCTDRGHCPEYVPGGVCVADREKKIQKEE